MDTRSKILNTEAARAVIAHAQSNGGSLRVVTGTFDVLQASHVRDLEAVAGDTKLDLLLVVLTPPADPILDERARAEMVAALAMVDYVVTAAEDLLCALPSDAVIHLEAEDENRARQLIEHVHRRHT